LRLVGSPDGRDGSIVIHQDTDIYDELLSSGDAVTNYLKIGHKSWVQVVRGAVEVNGKAADAGDGVAVEDEAELTVMSNADDSQVLVFDLS
jgi:redox-sensitive bicupin YhaK (pirin superfamily)